MNANDDGCARTMGELCERISYLESVCDGLKLIMGVEKKDNTRLRLKIADLETRLADKIMAAIERQASEEGKT